MKRKLHKNDHRLGAKKSLRRWLRVAFSYQHHLPRARRAVAITIATFMKFSGLADDLRASGWPQSRWQ